MADAEFLLTIGGTDVTPDVWSWRGVTYADSWTSHPTLRFTLKQAWGSVTTVSAYADVKLWNLLTGTLLFEGIVAPGQSDVRDTDPTWVEQDVSCVGYQSLLDSAELQVAYAIPDYSASGPSAYPDTAKVIRDMLAIGFADYRVNTGVAAYAYDGTLVNLKWGGGAVLGATTWAQGTGLASAIADVMEASSLWDAGYTSGDTTHPYVAKMLPALGFVLCAPDYAVRGSSGVTLSTAGSGRPGVVARVTDTGSTASAMRVMDLDGTTPFFIQTPELTRVLVGGTAPTNGYAVWSSPQTYATYARHFLVGDGSTADYYRVSFADPGLPVDVLVGHSVTFNTARVGTVTGTVQSVSTTFSDGVYDQVAANWPRFLDGTRNLDGTWNLDAAVSSVIPRRMRRTTMTVAVAAAGTTSLAVPSTFVGHYRRKVR